MNNGLLLFIPLACLAGTVQVPGTWSLLPQKAEAVSAMTLPPAVPCEWSGQMSSLAHAELFAADGAGVTELKDLPGVRIEGGAVSLVYGAQSEAAGFVRMAAPPVSGAEWRGSTYWTGGEPWARIGKDWMHPGDASDVARAFVAPAEGRVTISGTVKKLHLDGDAFLHEVGLVEGVDRRAAGCLDFCLLLGEGIEVYSFVHIFLLCLSGKGVFKFVKIEALYGLGEGHADSSTVARWSSRA